MGTAKEESSTWGEVAPHGGGGWWPVSASLTSPLNTSLGSGLAIVSLTFFKAYTNNHHPGE